MTYSKGHHWDISKGVNVKCSYLMFTQILLWTDASEYNFS